MFSSVSDLARTGKAILSSTLHTSAQTRSWFKPVSHTSNPANSLGRPWVIYSGGNYPKTAMVDAYTALGNIGTYSSYIGFVPDFNAGFTILAADHTGSPDLNAQADMISEALVPALSKMALTQAAAAFGGAYTAAPSSSLNSSTNIGADEKPGLFIDQFVSNDTDFRATLARLNGFDLAQPDDLSIRLYPMVSDTDEDGDGSRTVFRAVYQDKTEFADNDTPTCVSWMSVDSLKYGGRALDEFIFNLYGEGKAVSVEIPALRVTLEKTSSPQGE